MDGSTLSGLTSLVLADSEDLFRSRDSLASASLEAAYLEVDLLVVPSLAVPSLVVACSTEGDLFGSGDSEDLMNIPITPITPIILIIPITPTIVITDGT